MSEGPRSDPRRLADAVITLLETELAVEGFDLLDVRIFRGGGRLQVRIFLDTPAGGITLDQCAEASRSAGMLLEESDLIGERYVIEVSSPGIRRPLRTAAHFAAAVGQRVELRTGARTRVRGVLEASGAEGLLVRPPEDDAEPVRILPGDLVEANLDPDFDAQALINADRRRRKDERRRERKQRDGKKGRRARPKSDDEKKTGNDPANGST